MKGESYMLKYNVRGENIEVTDALRSYVEKRLKKLCRKAVKQVREVLRIESRCDCTRKLESIP